MSWIGFLGKTSSDIMVDDQRRISTSRKWWLFCCLLALAAGVVVAIFVKWSDPMQISKGYWSNMSEAHKPLASLRVFVPAQARDKFFSALTEFAMANGFQLRMSRLHPKEDWFSVDLIGVDKRISIWNPLGVTNFTIRMYAAPGRSPDLPEAARVFSSLSQRVLAVPSVEMQPDR
jgi:hypothetical protein